MYPQDQIQHSAYWHLKMTFRYIAIQLFLCCLLLKHCPLYVSQEILEDPKLADFKEGPVHTIVIDVECLAMLNKIPETARHLESQLKNELQAIVSRSTQQLIDAGPYPQGDIKLLQGYKLKPTDISH